jgi:hypothetical protein
LYQNQIRLYRHARQKTMPCPGMLVNHIVLDDRQLSEGDELLKVRKVLIRLILFAEKADISFTSASLRYLRKAARSR